MFKVKWDAVEYSSKQFGIWRFVFGAFLTFYYMRLFPYAVELYSRNGALPDYSVATFLGNNLYPSLLLSLDSPSTAQGILGVCILCSTLIMVGYLRRSAAFILWLCVTWLYSRNTLTNSPDYSFVNWLILILAVIPIGEDFSLRRKDPQWKMPKAAYWGAWIVLAFGYYTAGITKIKYSESTWRDGSALYYVLTTDNTRREWYGTLLNGIPEFIFWPITWGTLILETGAPFFVSFRKVRMWWWVAMTLMHVGIFFFINLPEVSLGMIIYHWFLWDPDWLPDCLRERLQTLASLRNRLRPRKVRS